MHSKQMSQNLNRVWLVSLIHVHPGPFITNVIRHPHSDP